MKLLYVRSPEFSKSYFYRRYFKHRYKKITEQDTYLFLEIIDTSRRKLIKKYPEVEFHVIFWDPDKKVLDALKAKKIYLHLINNIIPDISKNRAKYVIHEKYEGHPNALAHWLIAEYIMSNIISDKENNKVNTKDNM